MKKILFVLAVFLLGVLAAPAAAAEDCETSAEVLVEPVPHHMIVKFIMQGKFGDDRMGLFTSFVNSLKVNSLKEGSIGFYMYVVSFSSGEHGNGHMSDSQLFSGSKNPTWTVPSCGFSADAGYVFSGWEIYGDVYQKGDKVVLTEFNTKAAAVWQTV